jgi:uncharacterized membrane protein YuzA (DUF378 family)
LNWLLVVLGVGIENYVGSSIAQIVYVLVGLSAISEIIIHKQVCKECSKGSM